MTTECEVKSIAKNYNNVKIMRECNQIYVCIGDFPKEDGSSRINIKTMFPNEIREWIERELYVKKR